MFARTGPASLLVLCLLTACQSPRTATQVRVYVDAQSLVRAETRVLELVIRGGPPGELAGVPESPIRYTAPIDWPRDLTMIPLEGDVTRHFEIDAVAYDANRRVITVARLRAGFTENAARVLRLTLEDSCRGIICSTGYTCRSGGCVMLTDPDPDAGSEDLDAGVPDAPPTPCESSEICDDGVYCNGEEFCKDGLCRPGELVVCDDGVRCTEDVCTGSGCAYLPSNGTCIAGSGGRCDPTTGCQYDVCDVETTCRPEGCETTRCEGNTCLRTSSCTADQGCCAGECVRPGCADDDTCTADFCDEDPASRTYGCVHEPTTGPCNDGDACTVGESCSTSGTCGNATRRTCDDANPCTADTCDPLSGCQATPVDGPYEDGNFCTVGERCSAGTIVPGVPNTCDDGIACTVDSCRGGECSNMPDNGRCTAFPSGVCDPTAGCQYGADCAATCVPVNACETASCNAAGVCIRGSACVPDTNPCTDTVCLSGSCAHVPNTAACSDGNACTLGDSCSGGGCVGGAPLVCNDGNPCTTESCMGGACAAGVPVADGTGCSDGNPCSLGDRCVAGTCAGTGTNPCFDGNECTTDACSTSTGCVNAPVLAGSPCGVVNPSDCTEQRCNLDGACVDESICMIGQICCGTAVGRCGYPGDCSEF